MLVVSAFDVDCSGGNVVTAVVGTIVEVVIVVGDAALVTSCRALLSASRSGEGTVNTTGSLLWSDDESVASDAMLSVLFVIDSSPGDTDAVTLAVLSSWVTGGVVG